MSVYASFGPDAQAPENKKGAAAEAERPRNEPMIAVTTERASTPQLARSNATVGNRGDGIDRARQHAAQWLKSNLDRAQHEIHSGEHIITPEMAELLLKKNPDNRNIKKVRVVEIRADLEAGRYVLNGEPIIVSRDGLLNDGQHRLLACVESGVAFRSLVVFGVTRSSRLTLDQGGARTVADYLDMAGKEDHTKVMATVGRMLWQFKNTGKINQGAGKTGRGWPTKAESLALIEGHEREILRNIQAVTTTSKLIGSYSFVVFCRVLLERADRTMGPVFIDRLLDGVNLKAESPIFMLRERFINDPKMRQPERFEAVIRSWNALRTGKPLSRIMITGTVPKIEG